MTASPIDPDDFFAPWAEEIGNDAPAPPPHDLDAEAAVLSAILVASTPTGADAGALEKSRALRPEHFSSERNRRIFEAALELADAGRPVDVITVASLLRERGRLPQCGGMAGLTELLGAAPAVANVAAYVGIVRDVWARRERIGAASRLEILSRAGQDTSAEVARLVDLDAPTRDESSRVVHVDAEWYAAAPAARSWLLRDARHPKARGVFPLGKVGQLIAEGGAGKTIALCQLAVAVATGSAWLGTFSVATPGRSLLVLGEEDAEEARRRLYHAARAGGGRAPEAGAIEVLPLAGMTCAMLERDERGNAAETHFLRWLRRYVDAEGFRLVVVDPLSRFAGPDAEKDNAIATRFVQALESLTAPDRSVLNAHHVNKLSRGTGRTPDSSSGRGSSAFFDGARWQCALGVERPNLEDAEERARLGEIVIFAVTKSNYAAKPDPVLLRRDLDNGGALVPLDEADLELVEGARAVDPARAERRRAIESEREDTVRRRDAADDEMARQILSAHPGAAVRQLVPLVRKALACGGTRAHAALVRARGIA